MAITCEYHDDLKSCPFCKNKAWLVYVEFNDGDIWYTPNCSSCFCSWQENYETKDEAVKSWNTRI